MLILFVMLFTAITPTGNDTYYTFIMNPSYVDFIMNRWFVDLGVDDVSYDVSGVASACFWTHKYWNTWRWNSAVTYFLLISSYVVRAAALFESSETFFRRKIRDWLLGKLGKALDRKVKYVQDGTAHRRGSVWYQKIGYNIYLTSYAVTLALLDLYASLFVSLVWVLLSLIWGSLQMLTPRIRLANSGAIAEENTFGFGQIIPLMLLALPLVAAWESFYGR